MRPIVKNIKDYDLKELKEELINIGEKPFRAEQIFQWLYQEKVKSFDEMTKEWRSVKTTLRMSGDHDAYSNGKSDDYIQKLII